MAITSLPDFGADPVSITGPGLDAKVNPLATDYNGNIDNSNIASGAAIANSKLNLASISQNIAHSGTMSHTGVVTLTKNLKLAKGADVASANALTLGADGNYFDITGTTAITSIGTLGAGTVVRLHFDGILTFTHHSTDLVLPGGANITTAAGDECELVEYASGDWRCTSYTKASGLAVVSFTPSVTNALSKSVINYTTTKYGAVATTSGTYTIDDNIPTTSNGGNIAGLDTAITPSNSSNGLIIEGVVYLANDTTAATMLVVSLHQDATSAALGSWIYSKAGNNDLVFPIPFRYSMAAGTTSSTTFKLYVGANSASTTTINGFGGNRKFGGVLFSTMTVTEYKA